MSQTQVRQSARVRNRPSYLEDCVLDLDASGRVDIGLATETELSPDTAVMADSDVKSQDSSLIVIPDAEQTLTPAALNETVIHMEETTDDVPSEVPNTQELYDMIDRAIDTSAQGQAQLTGTPVTSTPRAPGSASRTLGVKSIHDKVDKVQRQLDGIEACVGLIPELQRLITKQKKSDDLTEEILKMQNKIKKMEKEIREAATKIKSTEEKLTESYEVSNQMKADLDTWRQRATDAEAELKQAKESALTSQKETPKKQPVKANSNKQGPVNQAKGGEPHKEESKSPTAKKCAAPNESGDVIYVRSPHILSTMEERKPFRYRGREYRYAEVAYQSEKVAHTLGEDSPKLKEIIMLSGLDSKDYVKHIPRSKSWQSCKESVLEDICRCLATQDTTFREALLATESMFIKHTVKDNFWGSVNQGQNKYGKILMKLRARLREENTDPGTKGPATRENEGFKAIIELGTEGLVLADSQCKFVNPHLIFGRSKVTKIKCSTARDLASYADDLGNAGTLQNVKHVLVNVGINDIRNRQNPTEVCSMLEDAIRALKVSCPRAHIYYSAPLKKHPTTELETLCFQMEEVCEKHDISLIQHDIYRHLYLDEFHISEEGTRVYAANVLRYMPWAPQKGVDRTRRHSYRNESWDEQDDPGWRSPSRKSDLVHQTPRAPHSYYRDSGDRYTTHHATRNRGGPQQPSRPNNWNHRHGQYWDTRPEHDTELSNRYNTLSDPTSDRNSYRHRY